MKMNMKNSVLLLLLVVVFIFAAIIITDMVAEQDPFTYKDLVTLFEEDKVEEFSIDTEGYMTLVDKDGNPLIWESEGTE